jgi:hypothetical protein
LGKIADIEKEIQVVLQAIEIWPENKQEYNKVLAKLRYHKNKLKRYQKAAIAKTYTLRRERKDMENQFRHRMDS